jgi:hypothetical protein
MLSEVEILGSSKLVYRPDKPLSCGAKVWIETTSMKIIRNDTSFTITDFRWDKKYAYATYRKRR